MSRLVLDRLGVHYGGEVAVAELTLRVEAGEWVCLIGPNGAGKSSAMRAVAGLVRHTGRVEVDGDVLGHGRGGRAEGNADSGGRRDRRRALGPWDRRDRARRVALVPQTPLIPAEMAVEEYVLLGRTPHVPYFGVETAGDRAVVADVLERLELERFARRPLGSLSGGELQRVVLARALAQQAPVLLLDEPTSALDLGHQQRVLELVARLRVEEGLTVLSAMHDLTLAGLFADRLVLMDGGRAVAEGPPSTVLVEAVIAEHYGASVRVVRGEDGTLVVVPVRAVGGAGLVPGRAHMQS